MKMYFFFFDFLIKCEKEKKYICDKNKLLKKYNKCIDFGKY